MPRNGILNHMLQDTMKPHSSKPISYINNLVWHQSPSSSQARVDTWLPIDWGRIGYFLLCVHLPRELASGYNAQTTSRSTERHPELHVQLKLNDYYKYDQKPYYIWAARQLFAFCSRYSSFDSSRSLWSTWKHRKRHFVSTLPRISQPALCRVKMVAPKSLRDQQFCSLGPQWKG
jgi:hypothetical protein